MLALPLFEWFRNLPDPRSPRKKKHDHAEILALVVIGLLVGKKSIRRICALCETNIDKLKKYMPLEGGIPSVSTISRMLAAVDIDLLCLSFMAWVGTYLDTRGKHIAMDGKGLRAGTRKIRGETTPYIMNAMETETKLVVGQWPVNEKTSEAGMLPDFIGMLELNESTVTIDAIGTSESIMEALHKAKAHFVLQVKKNCPLLYDEIMDLFDSLEEKEAGKQKGKAQPRETEEIYSCYDPGPEYNRERIEYRKVLEYHAPEGIKVFKEERPYIECVAECRQIRIEKIENLEGENITPSLKEFLESGSKKQPKPQKGDDMNSSVQYVGLISDKVFTAEELAKIKRDHWAIETSLHHVLDVTMGEDSCKLKNGREALSVLRKSAYNIARLLQIRRNKGQKYMIDIFDEIMHDLTLGLEYIFKPIPYIMK